MHRTAQLIVKKWSEDEIIQPSSSEYSSTSVMVTDSDGTYSLYVNYHNLNARTRPDPYTSPSMETRRLPEERSLYSENGLEKSGFASANNP